MGQVRQVFKIFPKRGSSGGLGKIGDCSKKGKGITFFHTNPSQMSSLCVWYVCLLLIYTILIGILCVSQEGVRLIEFNE